MTLYEADSPSGLKAHIEALDKAADDGYVDAEVFVGNDKLPVTLHLCPWGAYEATPLEWIDDNLLLVDGHYVYNVDTGNLKNILPISGLSISDYEVDLTRTHLALFGAKEGEMQVWLVDLSAPYTAIHVYTHPPLPPELAGNLVQQVAWGSDGTLYFDAFDGTTPVILRYLNGETCVFKQGACLPVASPNGEILAYKAATHLQWKLSQPPRTVICWLNGSSEQALDVVGKVNWARNGRAFAVTNPGEYRIYGVEKSCIKLLKEATDAPGARAFFDMENGKAFFKRVEFLQDGQLGGVIREDVSL